MNAFAALCSGLLLAATVSLQAHHSFSAMYDQNKPITLRGTVSKLGWSNPHAHIYIDVKNQAGDLVTWEIESAGASALLRQGVRKEDLIGTEVIIKGFLAKDGSPTANATTMTLVNSKKEIVNEGPTANP